jgi:hypothetical protein
MAHAKDLSFGTTPWLSEASNQRGRKLTYRHFYIDWPY